MVFCFSALALVSAERASALSCEYGPRLKSDAALIQAYCISTNVFIAEAVSITNEERPRRFSLIPLKSLKASPILSFTARDSGECSWQFKEGRTYLIFVGPEYAGQDLEPAKYGFSGEVSLRKGEISILQAAQEKESTVCSPDAIQARSIALAEEMKEAKARWEQKREEELRRQLELENQMRTRSAEEPAATK